MRVDRVKVIFRKELLETLRDRRTLFVMLLLPILLYPLLFIGMGFFMQAHIQEMRNKPVRLSVWNAGEQQEALEGLFALDAELALEIKALSTPELGDLCRQAGQVVSGKELELIILVDGPDCRVGSDTDEARSSPGPQGRIEILFDGAEELSLAGAKRAYKVLKLYNEQLLSQHLKAAQLDPKMAQPIQLERWNIASERRMGGFFASRVIPLILVLMVIMGAFYPAIDLSAGEKERGTLESLISTPISSSEIVAGKYLTVFSVSMIAATVNLISMGLTLNQMTAGISGMGSFSLSFGGALLVLALLVPTALLFSALMLALATFARDFKEAQNFLTPAFMVAIIPAALASLPGIELGPTTAMMPGLNIALVIKEILAGEIKVWVPLVMLINALYALLILWGASRLFANEQVLFGSGLPWQGLRGPQGLLSRLKQAPIAGTRPSLAAALLLFLLLLALLFHLGTAAQRWDLLWGLLITQWGLLLLPVLLMAWLGRLDWRASFRLRLPRGRALLAAIALAPSAWILGLAISSLSAWIFPSTEIFAQEMQKLFSEELKGQPLWLLLLAFALTPALCEEAVFRGLLLSGAEKLGRWRALLLNAALFGLFHLSIYRFLPTATLGLLIAFAVWQSGSIWVGVLIHFSTNALIFSADRLPEFSKLLGLEQGSVSSWIPAMILAPLLPLGLYLLYNSAERSTMPASGSTQGGAEDA